MIIIATLLSHCLRAAAVVLGSWVPGAARASLALVQQAAPAQPAAPATA